MHGEDPAHAWFRFPTATPDVQPWSAGLGKAEAESGGADGVSGPVVEAVCYPSGVPSVSGHPV